MLWGSRPPARGLRQALPHCRGARGEEWLPLHTCDVMSGVASWVRTGCRAGRGAGRGRPCQSQSLRPPRRCAGCRRSPSQKPPAVTTSQGRAESSEASAGGGGSTQRPPKGPSHAGQAQKLLSLRLSPDQAARIPGGVTSLTVLWLPLRLVPPVTSLMACRGRSALPWSLLRCRLWLRAAGPASPPPAPDTPLPRRACALPCLWPGRLNLVTIYLWVP